MCASGRSDLIVGRRRPEAFGEETSQISQRGRAIGITGNLLDLGERLEIAQSERAKGRSLEALVLLEQVLDQSADLRLDGCVLDMLIGWLRGHGRSLSASS